MINSSLLVKRHLIQGIPRINPQPAQPVAGQQPGSQALPDEIRRLQDYCRGLDLAVQELWMQVATLQEAISVQQGEITIKTGDASIVLKRDGTIVAQGKDITITGSGKVSVKATGNLSLKGSKIVDN